ncbi:cell division protein FtsQ/DivIB [Gilvimarinus sp. F26214L]|uniref:cell division protein FtsQ/DivIB n=1 Tax=Gilvimarinus sp. DZF01 TaxID=3461371 RepID=UPI0040459EA1
MAQAEHKTKRRGATVRGRAARRSGGMGRIARRLAQLGAGLCVLAAIGCAGYYGKNFVERASDRPINNIGVEGTFAYVSEQQISDIVTPMIVGGFLQSPLSAIKEKLEDNPWIAQAAVSRRWPDELFISITEEQPIARWADRGFLNHRGEFIAVEMNGHLTGLPLLTGAAGQERTMMKNYQKLAQTLGSHGLKIREFYSDELLSWDLVLANGLKITIGRDQTMEKIQRFLVVYNRELHSRLNEVARIDLRYGNGLAVEWKTATADSTQQAVENSDKKA